MLTLLHPSRMPLRRLSVLALALGSLTLAGCESERDASWKSALPPPKPRLPPPKSVPPPPNRPPVRFRPSRLARETTAPIPTTRTPIRTTNPRSKAISTSSKSDNEPSLDLQPDPEPQQLVSQPPPAEGLPGPVNPGSPPAVS
jgi:hypothetical protein